MAREIGGWLPDLPIVDKYDYVDSQYFSACFKVQVLERKTTPFCDLEVLFNPLFGNMMFINGEIQISQVDYDDYHAAMWDAADVPWNPRVLVVGDGDGGFTKYAHASRVIDVVERDPYVIEAGEKYFGAEWGKVNLHTWSLDEFNPREEYDAVMLAIDDGFNSATELETELDRVAAWLRPMGRIVAQAGTDLDPKHEQIFRRYKRWAEKRRFVWTKARAYVQCYFCHVNFFVAEKLDIRAATE